MSWDKRNDTNITLKSGAEADFFSDSTIMRENTLSRRQLTRMIYVEGFGAAGLTYPAAALWAGNGEGLLAFIFYGILLFCFTGYLLKMAKSRMYALNNPAASRLDKDSGRLPVWAAAIYLIRFFVNIWVLFYFFGFSIQNIYMPDHPMWWLLLPFAVLLWYCAQTSLQKHGRFLELLFPWIAALFVLVIIMAMPGIITKPRGAWAAGWRMFIKNVASWEINGLKDGLLGGYYLLLCSTPLEFIYFLVPFCRGCFVMSENISRKGNWKYIRSSVVRGVTGGYLCNMLLWFATVKTLGRRLTASTLWPVIKIMQLIHLPGGFLERFDILLVVYWILCMIGALSGYLYYGRRIMEETFFGGEIHEGGLPDKRKKQMAFFTALAVLAIYIAGCLLSGHGPALASYWNYKKWFDFPLIVITPLLMWIWQKQKMSPEKKRKSVFIRDFIRGSSLKLCITALLILTASFAITGCRKQSDAEKKRYVLSLYADISGDEYVYYTADARLAEMDEKESLVPCRIKRIRAKEFREMEEKFRMTEEGQLEWNHIFTIFIGPGLAADPEKLIHFLEEWDASWQKSPDVSLCRCTGPAETLFFPKDADNKKPEGSKGQQIRELIDQMSPPGEVCRTPIDVLKQYYGGAEWVNMYQIKMLNEEWAVSVYPLKIRKQSV